MKKVSNKLILALSLSASLLTSSLLAAEKKEEIKVSKAMQQILDEKYDGTLKTRGVKSLKDYIIFEKERYDWVFKNHPIFKTYVPRGDVVGEFYVADRGYEYAYLGNGDKFQKYSKRKGITATAYRIAETDAIEFPNKFVGPNKCGECHHVQYEQWSNSRHSSTIRFPGEHPELSNNLTTPVFEGTASILPKGITPDAIYATVGHLRTKFGYLDAWLMRGTYFVEDGLLKDGTGKIVAGSNQWSRTWANDLTPEVAQRIRKHIPTFPVTLDEHGPVRGYVRGLQSYAATYRERMYIQTASSYCQTCHPFKFDFKSTEEFENALGKPEVLREHTVSKGISCEECHGAGGHLQGGEGLVINNCERCHQRMSFRPFLAEKFRESKNPQLKVRAAELGMTAHFKSAVPSCGTEGAQSYFTAHYDAGMRCTTCHDPHSVTGYVVERNAQPSKILHDTGDYLSSFYTAPKIKKDCASCHQEQAYIAKNTKDTHSTVSCASCHMPFTMSCENWWSVMYADKGGFDTQRRSHVWKIEVSPDKKSLNPPAGQPRELPPTKKYKDWYIAKNDQGHHFIDLMWACGKTSWADKDMDDNKGCHSIAKSTLKKTLHFTNQKQIYDEVMGWQKPIKAIYDDVTVSIKGIYELLDTTKLSVTDRTRVNELVEKAQEAMDLIKKDGSWGVHGFKYTERRAKAAQAYVAEAKKILNQKK